MESSKNQGCQTQTKNLVFVGGLLVGHTYILIIYSKTFFKNNSSLHMISILKKI